MVYPHKLAWHYLSQDLEVDVPILVVKYAIEATNLTIDSEGPQPGGQYESPISCFEESESIMPWRINNSSPSTMRLEPLAGICGGFLDINYEVIYEGEPTGEMVFEFSTNPLCDGCTAIYGSDPDSPAGRLQAALQNSREVYLELNSEVFVDMIVLFGDGSKCSTAADSNIDAVALGYFE